MKKVLVNIVLVGGIILSVMLSESNKDNDPIPDNSDSVQNKGEYIDSQDGKDYKRIKIGDQILTAKNLRNASGQHTTSYDMWAALEDDRTDTAFSWYDNDKSHKMKYSALYAFAAVKNASPKDWHFPTNIAWTKLEQFIKSDGHSGNERAALKSVISWNEGDGNDKYSLTAFPRGYRYEEFGHDAYNTFGYLDNWWSVTKYNSNQSYFRGVYKGSHMRCIYPNKSFDLSVRCVRN